MTEKLKLSEELGAYRNGVVLTQERIMGWAAAAQQLEVDLAYAEEGRRYNLQVIDQRNAEIGRLQQELKQAGKELDTAAADRRALQANIDQLVDCARVKSVERIGEMSRINSALGLTMPYSVDEICAAANKFRALATNNITVQPQTAGGTGSGCGGVGVNTDTARDTMKRALTTALSNGTWLSSELLVDAVLMELFPQPGKRLDDIPVPQATRPAAALSFEEVTEPVIEWLNAHYNPHCSITIENDGATVLSADLHHPTTKFIKD